MRKVAQPGPASISTPEGATARNAVFSPNQMSADVLVGSQPARAVLNQNFADGWTTNAGAIERDPDSGRPSVVLPAGYSGTVVFTYRTPGLWLGISISLIAVIASMFVWRAASARGNAEP